MSSFFSGFTMYNPTILQGTISESRLSLLLQVISTLTKQSLRKAQPNYTPIPSSSSAYLHQGDSNFTLFFYIIEKFKNTHFWNLINVTCNLSWICQILYTLTRWYKANKRTFNSSKVSSNNRGNFRSKYHEKWYFTMSLLSLGMRTLVVVGYTQFIFEIV